MEAFDVVETNPNEVSGHGACLCSEEKVTDCTGPFVVFRNQEMDSAENPHPVACSRCIKAAAKALDKDDALGGTTPGVVPELMKGFVPTKRKPEPDGATIVYGDGRDEEPEVVDAEVVEEVNPEDDVEV